MTIEEKAKHAYEILSAGRTAFKAILNSGGSMEEAYFAANQAVQLWQTKHCEDRV